MTSFFRFIKLNDKNVGNAVYVFVRIDAHDLVHSVQDGLVKKDPKFLDNFDICYPLASMAEVERLKEAGLPWDYNEFCKDRKIKAHYGVYFQKK